jgi:hypothetical protein
MAPGGFFVKTRIQSLSFLATLAVVLGMISWGSMLNAQSTPSSSSPADQAQPAPTPDTPPTQQPAPTPAPDATTPSQEAPSAAPSQTPSQTPDQTQTPDSKPDTSATPNATDTPSAAGTQTFSGTVEKSGDKYVLKTDSGKTYDIDHQDDVKKFDGKRVRVQGKLDASGTMIQVK